MHNHKPAPGVLRHNRIAEEGLQRLERQLMSGAKISQPVLAQWISRYGEAARELIKKYHRYE